MKTIAATTRAILGFTLLGGCLARSDFGPQDWLVRDEAPTNWGDFAATLDVPDCPSSNPVLTVNTTADELDGGQSITDPSQAGDYLSFAEAIWIAANRGTPHNIFFDADVFPVATPGVIHVRDYYEMPWDAPGLCVDGRHRGVVVAYDDTVADAYVCATNNKCAIPLQDGALLVGLTLDGLPSPLRPHTSQVAGCRLRATYKIFEAGRDFVVGPGNVAWDALYVISIQSTSTGGQIVGNYFGFDPLTRELLPFTTATSAFVPFALRANVFGRHLFTLSLGGGVFGSPVVAEHNYFGVDKIGAPLPAGASGLAVISAYAGQLQIGPSNIIRNLADAAITFRGPSRARVSRNSISGNRAGIVFDEESVTAPIITGVTSSAVTGSCAFSGTIEVFSDAGDQGETFLGDTSCNAVSPWSLAVQVPRGRNVTATLTDVNGATSAFSLPFAAL